MRNIDKSLVSLLVLLFLTVLGVNSQACEIDQTGSFNTAHCLLLLAQDSNNTGMRRDSKTGGNANCPAAAIARKVIVGNNQRLGIRCYKPSNEQVNITVDKRIKQSFTKRFAQLDNAGTIIHTQSAYCPKDTFVDQVLFHGNDWLAIRCRSIKVDSGAVRWGSDYWSRGVMANDGSKFIDQECPNTSLITGVVVTESGLYIRCRQALHEGDILKFDGQLFTRYFAIQQRL